MRLTIIPSDGLVIKDGIGISGLDLSFIDPSIHALQWYSTHGELEIKNEFGKIVENREITSIDHYQQAIDAWEAAKIIIDNSNLPDK
jgi:hypothetical protein